MIDRRAGLLIRRNLAQRLEWLEDRPLPASEESLVLPVTGEAEAPVKAIAKCPHRLEDQCGPEDLIRGSAGRVPGGRGLALGRDTCIQILGECGLLPIGPVGILDLARSRWA